MVTGWVAVLAVHLQPARDLVGKREIVLLPFAAQPDRSALMAIVGGVLPTRRGIREHGGRDAI
jgi:hypothetical protein